MIFYVFHALLHAMQKRLFNDLLNSLEWTPSLTKKKSSPSYDLPFLTTLISRPCYDLTTLPQKLLMTEQHKNQKKKPSKNYDITTNLHGDPKNILMKQRI
jgi:hypothetical protein